MRRISFLLLLIYSIPAMGAVAPDAVDKGIQKSKDWLYKEQKDGHWETSATRDAKANRGHPAGGQWGGMTALVTYALLASGEQHQDPRIVQAVDFLKKAELTGVYALGLRCQVWLLLPQTPETKKLMQKDAQSLRAMMKTSGPAKGLYSYINEPGNDYSYSRSQYAVLGMWAAAQAGIEVGNDYWTTVEQAWLRGQDASGGWAYYEKAKSDYPLTPGMTAVGVATLFIIQEQLHASAGAQCKGNIKAPAIDKGMKWMADNFGKIATDQKYPMDFPYATLYGVERIGVASGYKYIGAHDWYDKGAAWLLKEQNPTGAWNTTTGMPAMANTSFALLFLARGRAPLAMNKLDYTTNPAKAPPWNQRPRDVANISRWTGRQSERDLNWQIVNLDSPLEDLHEAQILYISGNEPLNLRPQDKTKLKQFVEEGGMILGNSDCGAAGFATSFRKLGSELFPSYEFRELPADHPIYTNEQFMRVKWKTKPSVLGLTNGVRELMLLIPTHDPARTWQLQTTGQKEEHWQLAANVVLYSVDKVNLRNRGVTYAIARDEAAKAVKTVSLARIQYDGNWDPEPGGWTRIANLLHNRDKLDVEIKSVKIGAGVLDGMKIAHLTGTTQFKLEDAAREAIKKFIDGGGTLIIDAAGGASAFAQSAETELAAMFPEKLKTLPADQALFSAGGEPPKIRYRAFAQKVLGSLKDAPRLQSIEKSGRLAVLFSREDLSAGMVGQPVDGIVGYDPATATELMARMILHAAETSPAPATQPK